MTDNLHMLPSLKNRNKDRNNVHHLVCSKGYLTVDQEFYDLRRAGCILVNSSWTYWLYLNPQVNIKVLDVDEPPVFSQLIYSFSVVEESLVNNIGTISARDPDRANKAIRYKFYKIMLIAVRDELWRKIKSWARYVESFGRILVLWRSLSLIKC